MSSSSMMRTPNGLALLSVDYVKYVARQMGATVSEHQWNRLKNFLIDMFDDSIHDPQNTAFCESDSDDPEIAEPPTIVRQLPTFPETVVIWKPLATRSLKLWPRPAKITNIWA